MKKYFFLLFILSSIYSFSFDFNNDNFCLSILPDYIAVYENKIFYISCSDIHPKIVSVIDRPKEILNEQGYISLNILAEDYYIIDLNGYLLTAKYKDYIIDYFSELIGQPQIISVEASSEFIDEKTYNAVFYKGICPLYRLNAQRPFMEHYLYYNGLPWIPDLRIDSSPYIDIELAKPQKTMSILPGYVDFYNHNLFYEYSRIKNIEVFDLFTNESLGIYELKDELLYTSIIFQKSHKAFRIKLLDYYPGTIFSYPCISSILFLEEYALKKGDYGKHQLDYFIEEVIHDYR